MGKDHLLTGQQGEQLALGFLRRLGFTVLARNVRCPGGELDVVALHRGVVHVVEVKCRQHPLAQPEQAVGPAKQRRVARAAEWFIQSRSLEHLPCQFDIVAVHRAADGRARIEFLEDAFQG